jgi:hypothetical protein
MPSSETFTMTDFDFGRWSTGCGNWPSSIPASASLLADNRRRTSGSCELFYEGG